MDEKTWCYTKQFVDLEEATQIMLTAITNDTAKGIYEVESDDFRRGAIWGATWIMLNIMSACPKYTVSSTVCDPTKEKFIDTYCVKCGSQRCDGPDSDFAEGCPHYILEFWRKDKKDESERIS